MDFYNEMSVTMLSNSQNESFARTVIASFISYIDPTINELTDIKTSVSEAVTNAIIHGYENKAGDITLYCKITDREIYIEIRDGGKGIENVEEARTPLYTSKPESERSGLGFTVMESFMDEVHVVSELGTGTTVQMKKTLKP